jgi:hypothetical protein
MATTEQAAVSAQPDAILVRPDMVTPARMAAAIISAMVGGIHLAVTQEHFAEWWVFGAFFLVVGVFQVAFAPLILRWPTWPVALTGIVVNLTVVLVWVASRTVGLPIVAPESSDESHTETAEGGIEAVGTLDLASTAGELVLIALLLTLLPSRLRRATGNVLLLLGVSLWIVRFSGALG